jgi:hydrogenase maturation protein HypF
VVYCHGDTRPGRAGTPREGVATTVDEPGTAPQRLRLEVRGAVQGVGFRPFVFRLAEELALPGWVLNDARGVFIEVEGDRAALERFRARLERERPPRALVLGVTEAWLPPAGYRGFEIRHSDEAGAKTALVLPDLATCPDCLAEVLDPAQRRHRYPFTNCTNCGPRFTILHALPYDRPNTTMRGFVLCPDCHAEYVEPHDRRFHAQPIACEACGPRLALWEAGGTERCFGDAALREAAAALAAGGILGVKGLGGFHLVCDARDGAAVARLRERKLRHGKPLALMVRDLEQARTLCEVTDEAARWLAAPEAPILLLPRRAGARVAAAVAPGNPWLGVMLPSTPLHHLLLRDAGFPVVATSGNLSDEPICTN